ncbi:MAG: DUF805 domain-containing protein [Bacteroidota bacterium]|nr:DUF805 domain-containing protein [Bacteroidota bacterium]
MKYFKLAFINWNKFNGRANRSEFWYFNLFYFILSIILYYIDISFLGYNPMDPTSIGISQSIFGLVVLIPSISLTVRRLHDVNKSGWNMLWILTLIGAFYVLYLNIIKGNEEDNNYGPPSKV